MSGAINLRSSIGPILIGVLIAFLGSVIVGAVAVATVSFVRASIGLDARLTTFGLTTMLLLIGCLMYATGGFVGSRLSRYKSRISALWIGMCAVLVDVLFQGIAGNQILLETVVQYLFLLLAALIGGLIAYHLKQKSNKAFERTP